MTSLRFDSANQQKYMNEIQRQLRSGYNTEKVRIRTEVAQLGGPVVDWTDNRFYLSSLLLPLLGVTSFTDLTTSVSNVDVELYSNRINFQFCPCQPL